MLKPFCRVFIITFIFIILAGCASKQISTIINDQTIYQRTTQLNKITHWKVKGKIAFIQETKRESFSLTWQVNEKNNSQQLDLNSYLGINALHLESNKNQHTIEVDGNKYQSENLDDLIYSLTGMVLPTKALSFWLKGLPYQNSDNVIIDLNSKLPKRLLSHYKDRLWIIDYANYTLVHHLNLATKFTIKTDNLTLKIRIKKWSLHQNEQSISG